MSFTPVDLSRLAVPDAVEHLDYEVILDDIKQQAIAILPGLEAELRLESSFSSKILEIVAVRELMLRARVNDSVRAVLLATATGADLDNLVALLGVERQVIVPADEEAVPPIEEVLEEDAALRARAQLSLEGFTTAGTVGSYRFHALSADGRVRDVGVTRPIAGRVLVTVLSHEGDGVPGADLLQAVAETLEVVRPLCDDTVVAAPSFVDFGIEAVLLVAATPGAEVVRQAAIDAVNDYLEESFMVGRIVRRNALLARLMQDGVENVVLVSPAADVMPGATGVARVGAIAIDIEVSA